MTNFLRAQISAGITLLGLRQEDFAKEIGVSGGKVSKALSGQTKSKDVLDHFKNELGKRGIVFLESGGVDLTKSHTNIIEGRDCYLKLLSQIMSDQSVDELLIMFSSDKVSPPAVNDCYRFLRSKGIGMRQLIKGGDTYIMGELKEYRTIPEKYFTNVVTLVYGNSVAQVSGDETKIVIYGDQGLAERERRIFNYFWDHGGIPEKSTADERF
ncbi:MAG: hypothetical protein ABJF04_16110 [Reichenbachiella sp.]|uniref:hypothetical protein n=1 Tax=Reichenbachiella sp. TaxID=2184521 RepID=UPI00326704E5